MAGDVSPVAMFSLSLPASASPNHHYLPSTERRWLKDGQRWVEVGCLGSRCLARPCTSLQGSCLLGPVVAGKSGGRGLGVRQGRLKSAIFCRFRGAISSGSRVAGKT